MEGTFFRDHANVGQLPFGRQNLHKDGLVLSAQFFGSKAGIKSGPVTLLRRAL